MPECLQTLPSYKCYALTDLPVGRVCAWSGYENHIRLTNAKGERPVAVVMADVTASSMCQKTGDVRFLVSGGKISIPLTWDFSAGDGVIATTNGNVIEDDGSGYSWGVIVNDANGNYGTDEDATEAEIYIY